MNESMYAVYNIILTHKYMHFMLSWRGFNSKYDNEKYNVSYLLLCMQVIEDSKSAIVFTTERVVCSLADLLKAFDHIAGGAAVHFDFFNSGKHTT